MPSIYGSSRIRNVSGISTLIGPTGSTGTAGPTGPTGGTGTTGAGGTFGVGIFSGLTGASGGDGIRFFREGEYGGDFITFYLTDGTTLGISGARGATGEASNDVYQISNTITDAGYGGVFDFKNGITAHFRNLTVSGRDIEINANDYSILLRGVTYDTGILGNTGELLYQFDGLSAHGAKNTYWDNANNNLLARILVHREADDSNTLLKLPTNEQTIARKDSPGASVAFEHMFKTSSNRADETDNMDANIVGIHLGKTADDAGAEYNWIYHFPGSTFGSIIQPSTLGSCCFCEDKDDPYAPDDSGCIDYVTEAYCSSIGGKFSTVTCLNRPEGPNCLTHGSCCINDICVSSSENKCVDVYGGFFVPDLTCDELALLGDADNPIGCPNPCADRGSCCINNICYDLTEYECSLQPNGLFFSTPCSITNCCLEGHVGACCMGEVCYETTPLMCSNMGGVFWGIGSACSGPYGAWNGNNNYELPGVYGYPNCILANGQIGSDNQCIGWTQVISDECTDNICACEEGGLICPCESETDEYGCNICGSNTESCGTIVLMDGSCWECCCDSTNATTTTTEDPNTTTTTIPPYGYCCADDDEGIINFPRSIAICVRMNPHDPCTTYCSSYDPYDYHDWACIIQRYTGAKEWGCPFPVGEEPSEPELTYLYDCNGIVPCPDICDIPAGDGNRECMSCEEMKNNGYPSPCPLIDGCIVTEEEDDGGEIDGIQDFPRPGGRGGPDSPGPGSPRNWNYLNIRRERHQIFSALAEGRENSSPAPRGMSMACSLTLEVDCSGDWYEDYDECISTCNQTNACCHEESGTCYHVDNYNDCVDGNEFYPNQTCMDVGCGGDGTTDECTSDDDCIENYCCSEAGTYRPWRVCLPCGWEDDCCTNPDVCPEGWECNTSMCACIQTGGPGDPEDDSGGGPAPDDGSIGEGVWCCNGGMLGGGGCDCASWPTNFCCVYVPIDLNPECIGYESGPHGTEEECYQSCCNFETEGATWNGPRPCEEETDCNGEQCCCAGYCTNCIQDANDPAGGWICPPKFYG